MCDSVGPSGYNLLDWKPMGGGFKTHQGLNYALRSVSQASNRVASQSAVESPINSLCQYKEEADMKRVVIGRSQENKV